MDSELGDKRIWVVPLRILNSIKKLKPQDEQG
jgi:hypothetical protein